MGMTSLWCVLCALPALRPSLSIELRAKIEAITLGMSTTLACSPFWVNSTFFATAPEEWLNRFGYALPDYVMLLSNVSAVFTLAAAACMARKWTQLRTLWFAVIAIRVASFTWCIPSLCALTIIGAVAIVSGRKSTAILCAAMMIWWVGSFYFSLQWLLVHKATFFAVSGILSGLTAAFLIPADPTRQRIRVALHALPKKAF